MNPKHKTAYLGRSAHLAVLSELRARGYTVTIPEIDVGRDVLAFLETKPEVTSLQVKSTACKRLKPQGSFRGQIDVPLSQLTSKENLYYVFAFDLDGNWVDCLVISREKLDNLRVNEGIGSQYVKRGKFYVKFWFTFKTVGDNAGVTCGTVSFNDCRNAFETLPNPPQARATAPVDVGGGQPVHTQAQTAVMSTLLRMGSNVAAIDIDRILAFQDDEPGFTQIRVKASDAVGQAEQGGYTADFELPLEELRFPSELFYVFVFAVQGRLTDFLIISRARLDELRLSKDLGSEHEHPDTGASLLTLTLSLRTDTVTCGDEPFDDYRNAWTTLPPLAHPQA